jgi:hypothetical protein
LANQDLKGKTSMVDHVDKYDGSHISPAVREALKEQPKEIADKVRRPADGGGNAREDGDGRPAVGTPR